MPVQPFDPAQGKPINPAQGSKRVVGDQPADILPQKPPVLPGQKRLIDFIKVPAEQLFSGISQILFLASVVVVVGICIFFLGLPGLLKSVPGGSVSNKVGPFVPPINVADVNFPSGHQQDLFLKNFQDAGKTSDYQERYKLLQDDYMQLLGFYTQDHDPKTRKVLEQYAQYMVNNYQEHAQESIYTVPCFDSGCGTAKYPQEIQKIKVDLEAASASASLKDSVNKRFEAASFTGDKEIQGANYLNAFISLRNEYQMQKAEAIKSIAQQLLDYIKNNYPNDYRRYQNITGGKVEI
jgi:hypothetical protein